MPMMSRPGLSKSTSLLIISARALGLLSRFRDPCSRVHSFCSFCFAPQNVYFLDVQAFSTYLGGPWYVVSTLCSSIFSLSGSSLPNAYHFIASYRGIFLALAINQNVSASFELIQPVGLRLPQNCWFKMIYSVHMWRKFSFQKLAFACFELEDGVNASWLDNFGGAFDLVPLKSMNHDGLPGVTARQ
jgi:hypothetical protein